MKIRMLLPAALGLALCLEPSIAKAECTAPSGVCVRSGDGVGWKAGESLSDKQRAKEARKNKKRDPVIFYLSVDGGRGSVFIDGVWIGAAPVQAFELKPGNHDLQVRDGSLVLAAGVLVVPRDPGGDVELEVAHRS
jgi:hypothetical protein